jgi:hypothetical protein
MPTGEKQIAALRLLLAEGNHEKSGDVVRAMDDPARRDLLGLVSATLLELADRKFEGADLPGAVIDWVAEFRATSTAAADALDPAAGEQVILLVLGMSDAADLDPRKSRDTQLFLVQALVHDLSLDAQEMDELLASAWKLVERSGK